MLVCQPFAHEAAGASDTRHSLRPLANRGPSFFENPGAIAPRECLYMSYAVVPRAGGASTVLVVKRSIMGLMLRHRARRSRRPLRGGYAGLERLRALPL